MITKREDETQTAFTLRRIKAGFFEEVVHALSVPAVWSNVERDGMADAYAAAREKHGHYEALFAVAAWLLRHRAGEILQRKNEL